MFKSTLSLMTAIALLISAQASASVTLSQPTALAHRLLSAPESPGRITSFHDPSSADAQSMPGSVIVVDDLVITQSVTLQPGNYNLLDVNHDGLIHIAADNITLDGSGVFINGIDLSGHGIVMNGHSGLTLSHFDIRGFDYGIDIQNSTGVTIENSNISGNRKDTASFWLDINVGGYGGGVRFTHVTSSTVQTNTLTNQSTGVEMINSHYNAVRNNVTSSDPEEDESKHNSAWGIRLHSSTHNVIQGNTSDYVDRERYGLSSGDSAGVLLVVGSHSNRVISNTFTHSGDGFFIGNEHGSPSDDNYVAGNDGSYSPHNAFEATFSGGNVFESNIASHSNYGFWLGYSHNTQVNGSEINDNSTAGIEVEHGYDNQFDRNTIQRNPGGIVVRDDGSASSPSTRYLIRDNTISLNSYGIIINDTDVVSVTRNVIKSNASRGVWALAGSDGITLSHNNLLCSSPSCQYAVYNDMNVGHDILALNNWWGTTSPGSIQAVIFDHVDSADKGYVYYTPFLTMPISGSGILATPDALDVVALVGQTSQAALNIHNHDAASAAYTVTTGALSWLSVSPSNGVVPSGGSATVIAALNARGLAQGVYYGVITVAHDRPGIPITVPVTFQVTSGGCGPQLSNWQTTTPLPLPSSTPFDILRGQQLVIHNGYVYVFGGRTTGDAQLTQVYYSAIDPDGTLGGWIETMPLPATYYDHVAVRVGDHMYLITGAAGATDVYHAHVNADGSLGAWTSTAMLTPSRQNFAAVAYGNYIYASGGNSGGTQSFVKYTSVKADGSLNAWMDTTALPKPIEGHTMLAYEGYLYVLAPDRSTYYALINPEGTVGNWAVTTLLPYVISLYASFENNGFLYTVGGNSPSVQYGPVAGDHTLGQWQRTKSLPEPRSGLRVGANDCVVYAVGGYDGSYRDTVYLAELLPPLPVADFIAAPLTGAAPLTVTFTDLSTGAVANRLWDFGDSITSTPQNPTHVYHHIGNYTVTLTVSGPAGSHTLTRTSLIAVTQSLTTLVYLPLITR